ncbi:MAG: SAM-dependent methyltransferase [Haloechinothrix sp.]
MNSAEETKACCAAAYGNDAVALVLGQSYHPGGLSLTRRLAERLGSRSGHRVLDVAAGPGATARLLAVDYDVVVDGVDLGEATVEKAWAATAEAGLTAKARFRVGDAEQVRSPDATFDAVVCEYSGLLAGAGLRTVHTEHHDDALAGVIDQIEARIRLLRMTAFTRLTEVGVDVDAVLHYCAAAKQAVADGLIGYALLVAEKLRRSP